MTDDRPEQDESPRSWNGKALAALWYGWGEAYDIGHDDERGYWARRLDGLGDDITADDPDRLWAAIRADYAVKDVPRDLAPRQGRVRPAWSPTTGRYSPPTRPSRPPGWESPGTGSTRRR